MRSSYSHSESRGRSYCKMCRIIDRCLPWSYGDDYVPALLATRNDGASRGRLHQIPAPGWKRSMHFMSAAEARIAAWVAYQPDFVEGLENRPCVPIPGLPVLDGHPLLAGKPLPSSSGTVELAKRLGIRHPTTVNTVKAHGGTAPVHRVDFYPLTSDLVGIFKSSDGVRAVNLFIKKTAYDLVLDSRHQDLFRIEQAYYAEAGVPTVKVCESELDPVVTNNLVRLIKLGRPSGNLSHSTIGHVLRFMEQRVFESAPASWSNALLEKFGLSTQEGFAIFHYGVFRRYLRVDLTEAVAMDRVHRPERVNFAANFASRFLEPLP